MPTQKFLWLVQYASIANVIQQATAAGVTTLVVRTDNDLLKAINLGHAAGLQVMGWRWPSALSDSAMNEANIVANLFTAGLDGYVVDPEGEPGKPYNWDLPGLASTANAFCSRIKAAANGKPFGVTSHYLAAAVFPHLPWSTFVGYADMLLPQAYWRATYGVIGHGDPVENYTRSLAAWGKLTSNPGKIVPMAGELGSSTPAEITEYATHALGLNKDRHYYAYQETLTADMWAAIKAG